MNINMLKYSLTYKGVTYAKKSSRGREMTKYGIKWDKAHDWKQIVDASVIKSKKLLTPISVMLATGVFISSQAFV